jgi:hypothetical protein
MAALPGVSAAHGGGAGGLGTRRFGAERDTGGCQGGNHPAGASRFWPLRTPCGTRPGRAGPGVPRSRSEPGTCSGAQGAPRRGSSRAGSARAVRGRSAGHGGGAASQSGEHLRGRGGWRRAVLRDGLRGGTGPRQDFGRRPRPFAPGRRVGSHAGRRRSGGARPRRAAPGFEALQRVGGRSRRAAHRGLRPGQMDRGRRRVHADSQSSGIGFAALHGPGAGRRPASSGGPDDGRVRLGGHPLSPLDRPSAFRGRIPHRGAATGARRGSDPAPAPAARCARRPRDHLPESAPQRTPRTLRQRPGIGR